jgi:hypothetical protein
MQKTRHTKKEVVRLAHQTRLPVLDNNAPQIEASLSPQAWPGAGDEATREEKIGFMPAPK